MYHICRFVVTVTAGWRKLHNEKPCNLIYNSPHLIRTIVPKKMNGMKPVAHMKERRNMHNEFILGNDLGV
jgi:hypothetical protein